MDFKNGFLNLVGRFSKHKDEYEYDEYDEYEDEYDEYEDDYKEVSYAPKAKQESAFAKREQSGNVVSLSTARGGNGPSKIIICNPKVVKDATTICEHLISNSSCVVNLEGLERKDSQRIADFLGGVSFAISGTIEKISDETFLIVPANVEISSEMRAQVKSSSASAFNWGKTAMK